MDWTNLSSAPESILGTPSLRSTPENVDVNFQRTLNFLGTARKAFQKQAQSEPDLTKKRVLDRSPSAAKERAPRQSTPAIGTGNFPRDNQTYAEDPFPYLYF